ncbi:cation-transporting ATPase, putative [Entamoeba invadens IP1]|uniref:Phospholipid-transporting ATPase n=1 Tax=Entamoeba invadens IP1 TaxID=370355 RepID=A0A0A1TZY0_ENTIV|nr:cation-transporting ATPase, putative [Entamoeba invadens IP1]ELP87197.1 cation-transporting ATPase, putative [Entamoeba invadens IP1]|eukprot:XP_004253968.1 cation-transporting ATPase, putative [Entamoeba invadens IP1]
MEDLTPKQEDFNDFAGRMRQLYEPRYKIISQPGTVFHAQRDFRRWHQKVPFFWTYKPYYEPRTLRMPMSDKEKSKYLSNKMENNKYNWWSFIPVAYLLQFKYTYNIFFLFTVLTQFIPSCKVGYMFQHVTPLIFVLTVAVLKELFDEVHTRIQDKIINDMVYMKLTDKGEQHVISKEIKVGDIICLKKGSRVPADMIALQTTGKNGICYVKTTQFDGETDWKIRHTIPFTQVTDKQDLPLKNFVVDAETPNTDIKKFSGRIREKNFPLPLDVGYILWNGFTIVGEEVIGLVVYTGKESKLEMAREESSHKMGVTEKELNVITAVCIGLLFALVLLMTICNSIWGSFTLVAFLRYVILAAPMIPISLRVNLEFSKIFYSLLIQFDPNIPGTDVKNTNLPEALGRVDYIFMDKTGTLTMNDMVFKKLAIENRENITANEIEKTQADVNALLERSGEDIYGETSDPVLRVLFGMALCHNVTPSLMANGQIDFQSSSVDEYALVTFVKQIGIELIERDTESMTLRTDKFTLKIKICGVIPFTSERKRMGIIVQIHDRYILLIKGAEVVMKRMLPNEWCVDKSTEFAREGLRGLVYGYRVMTQDEFDTYESDLATANSSLTEREEKVYDLYNSIEHDLQLLGVTGVEDKLQEGVPQAIELIQRADIKTWVLTGDKVETATGIAQTSGILPYDTEVIYIKGNLDEVANIVRTTNSIEKGIIIEGETLEKCLDCFPKSFFKFCEVSKAVVCARCSPQQKTKVVVAANKLGKNSCAVGDGGNDVGMIREAVVGIGVKGREGREAALAADFSTSQFSYISDLFLWHGRTAYKRTATLSHLIIHRGIIYTIMQIIFSAVFKFAPLPLFVGWYTILFTVFFNEVPIMLIVTDFDMYRSSTNKFPEIYKQLRESRDLSLKVQFQWICTSIFQGTLIILVALILTHEQKEMDTLAFAVLNLVFLIDCISCVKTWNWYMVLGYIGSLAFIFGIFYILPSSIHDTSYIKTSKFFKDMAICIVAPLFPRVFMFFFNLITPPKIAKLERNTGISFTLSPNPLVVLQENIQTNDTKYSLLN